MTDLRVLNGNIGPRWTAKGVRPTPADRKIPLRRALTYVPDLAGVVPAQGEYNPAGVMLLQECVADAQRYIVAELAERGFTYVGFGNGIQPRTSLDKDRSGDNGVILYDAERYKEQGRRIAWAGVAGGMRTYCRAIQLRRKGTQDSAWFLVTHPPNSVVSETYRMKHVRFVARLMGNLGVDHSRGIWGADWNSDARYPARGVRTLLRNEYRYVDVRDVLAADMFAGNSLNTANGFKAAKRDGRQIDATLVGAKIRARWSRIIRNDEGQNRWAADHQFQVSGLTI